jgi:hypothetical protein
MRKLLAVTVLGVAAFLLHKWYNREVLLEGEGFVRLQSEHEHFHFHVDLPPGMEIQPGDTLEIMHLPPTEDGRTNGEICYRSPIRLGASPLDGFDQAGSLSRSMSLSSIRSVGRALCPWQDRSYQIAKERRNVLD